MRNRLVSALLVICLLSSFLSGCGSSGAGLPVVKVDHNHFADPSLFYQITAGQGFLLDASTYEFRSFEGNQPLLPNYVEVVRGTGLYGQAWETGVSSLAVTVDSLKPIASEESISPFSGNEQFMVAIGRIEMDGSFNPYWMGAISVVGD